MTGIGWLIILLILGFVVYTALKLYPIYYDYFLISSSMNALKSQSGMGSKSPGEVKKSLLKQLNINGVRDLDRDDIYVTVEKGVVELQVEYEVRTSFMGNIDLVASFDKSVEFTGAP
jgi:hypothetical protein